MAGEGKPDDPVPCPYANESYTKSGGATVDPTGARSNPNGAPYHRRKLSATDVAGIDGKFHAHSTYPNSRKRRATIACGDGHVGGSHRPFEWSVQDVYGEDGLFEA